MGARGDEGRADRSRQEIVRVAGNGVSNAFIVEPCNSDFKH